MFLVKFAPAMTDPQRKDSFFKLPRSLNGLSDPNETWDIIEKRYDQDGVAVACRNRDYRICLLVDQKNSVAGLEYSVRTLFLLFVWIAKILIDYCLRLKQFR